MNIGNAIQSLRKKKKERQGVFAHNIGITQAYLSLIENGYKKPSLETLQKISIYLNVPLPVMFWFSLSEEDIDPDKTEAYNMLKPTIDKMIEGFISIR